MDIISIIIGGVILFGSIAWLSWRFRRLGDGTINKIASRPPHILVKIGNRVIKIRRRYK